MESISELLHRIYEGDGRATGQLFHACQPILRRFAHGRLPRSARGPLTTEDVVSVALASTIARLDQFRPEHEGALLAYARTAVRNAITDYVRRADARPQGAEIDDSLASSAPSPVEEAIGREFLEQYERALQGLTPDQYQAFTLRMEFGFSYDRVAEAMGKNSPDAARMLVERAARYLRKSLAQFEEAESA